MHSARVGPTMRTRRDVLAAVGATAIATLAGCTTGRGNGNGKSTDAKAKNLTHVNVSTPVDVEQVQSMPTPVRGDPNANVTVMVFEDYACPHCAHYETEVAPRVVRNYTKPGKVRYEHHDFPIPVSKKWSYAGANAARAVQDALGDTAFFDYTHTLFANQQKYVRQGERGYDYLATVAQDAGASARDVVRAAKGGEYDPVLKADRKHGSNLGVRGTPTVFVNGTATKNHGYDAVSSAIDSALGG